MLTLLYLFQKSLKQEYSTSNDGEKDENEYVEVKNAETQTIPEDYIESYLKSIGSRKRNDSSESEDDKLTSITTTERYKKTLRLTKENIVSFILFLYKLVIFLDFCKIY